MLDAVSNIPSVILCGKNILRSFENIKNLCHRFRGCPFDYATAKEMDWSITIFLFVVGPAVQTKPARSQAYYLKLIIKNSSISDSDFTTRMIFEDVY